MDFKAEEEKLLLKIMDLRSALSATNTKQEEMILKIQISMLTGVSLWLMSNAANINNLADFRERLDVFGKVLNHPSYKLMNDCLCISSSINSYLEKEILSNELMDVLEMEDLPSNSELIEISKTKYQESGKCYSELKYTSEFLEYTSLCGYTMNFQFDGDYKESEDSFITVNSFYGVLDELESIYQQKKISCKEQRKHKGIPKK